MDYDAMFASMTLKERVILIQAAKALTSNSIFDLTELKSDNDLEYCLKNYYDYCKTDQIATFIYCLKMTHQERVVLVNRIIAKTKKNIEDLESKYLT